MIDPSVFDALPDALLVVRDEVVVWTSAATCRMLGAAEGSLYGRRLETLLAPGDRGRLAVLEQQRREGWQVPETCRVQFVRDDGQRVKADLRFNHSPLAGGDGAPRSELVLAARDVTEIDRAEALMQRLAELSADPALMLDEGALLDASEPIFLALGWRGALTELFEDGSITRRVLAAPPGDPIGDYGRTLVGKKVPLERTPILAEVQRTGHALFLDNVPGVLSGPPQRAQALSESMERARLGRSIWAPVRVAGKPTHLLALSGKDLTEHDFIAIQLFAAQIGAAIHAARLRAELVRGERLAAVGEMAAVLAHEVRNPIAIIVNALGSMRRLLRANEDAGGLVEIIAEEAERLRRLMQDLLEFARPRAPERIGLELSPIVTQAAEAARQDAAFAPTTRVAIEVPESLPLVLADATLLRHALVNLIVNAFQHVPEGGRVTISASPSTAPLATEITLRVCNDGGPIPPEHAARIFEPFFTTRATGTGLGLAIVRRLVESMGGRVALEATERGVSFAVRLAMTREEPVG